MVTLLEILKNTGVDLVVDSLIAGKGPDRAVIGVVVDGVVTLTEAGKARFTPPKPVESVVLTTKRPRRTRVSPGELDIESLYGADDDG